MLATLMLARDGHRVTVVERDLTELPPTPDEAFAHWDRTGAPHARQSHALLARLRTIMQRRMPDVLDSLQDWGVTELTVDRLMPPTITDRAPRDGDDELVLLACRRLTLEWALRRAATAEPGVAWVAGRGVRGLVADGTDVRGVGLEDGTEVRGDLVVVAGGRRSPVMSWIADLGGPVQPTEDLHECGIVYWSRFYRLRPGEDLPILGGMGAGGDLGYLKFGGFYGDNGTFSVTLAAPTDDVELRKLSRVPQFEATLRTLPTLEPWMRNGLAEPISDVQTMARLRNRVRHFVVDGAPVATGLAVIGDAAIATNPLYGKGCSTAGIAADELSGVLRAHGGDRHATALALHHAMTTHVEPHYRTARRQDEDAQKVRSAQLAGTEPDPMAAGIRDFVLNGLLPATRTDPTVYRAFFRSFNLLDAPDALLSNAEVIAACQAAFAARDTRPPLPPLGPERDELVAILAAA